MFEFDFTDQDVAEVRHVVQRILVPCVWVIGLLGNSVSIYVLTRKRMRCTTNIYLTALAMTDIIYLTMALLLSLQHYEYIKRHCEFYYRYYGVITWLCDAGAYISIYIAVCFTIERFIAIRYPLKRQTFCTESLAKKVIAGVALFCLLSTISTAFEHEHRIEYRLIDSHGKPCNLTVQQYVTSAPMDSAIGSIASSADAAAAIQTIATATNVVNSTRNREKRAGHNVQSEQQVDIDIPKATNTNGSNNSGSKEFEQYEGEYYESYKDEIETTTTIRTTSKSQYANAKYLNKEVLNIESPMLQQKLDKYMAQMPEEYKIHSNNSTTTDCQNVTYFVDALSILGQNELYNSIWYSTTLLVFVLIPLLVLATFNCFLILMVRRSKSLRSEMTNAQSIRKSIKRKVNSSSVSQENRVTVTLIAVVLLFIVCQLPWAIYLIYSSNETIKPNTRVVLGNIFNFFAQSNAAANFFLYCVLSDKYRKTVRELITGYRYRNRNTQRSASIYTQSTALNGGGGLSGVGGGSSRRYHQQRPAATTMLVIK